MEVVVRGRFMSDLAKWDWDTKEKLVADINELKEKFVDIRELTPSDDGEKIASVVLTEDKKFTTCVNGQAWEETFDRVWSLKFNPDNQLLCFVYRNYEWNFVVEHEISEEAFDYLWNLTLTPNGKGIAFNIKVGEEYGAYINGKRWEKLFVDARDLAVSPDGKKTASRVQTKRKGAVDIFAFWEKIWTIAVDGNPWDNTFLAVWGVVFSPDSAHVATAVRTDQAQYTIALDGKAWEGKFGLVWDPIFKPGSNDVIAPVR